VPKSALRVSLENVTGDHDQPLTGIRVVDFTTLVPGPMATLALSEAGADVLKVERPGGDEARGYEPKIGENSAVFLLLNRGKRSITLDLKRPEALEAVRDIIAQADVVIEQFRPGVMARLGLGYEALAKLNPRLIYCSLTGYGQNGPLRDIAGHDLNYVAHAGLLSMIKANDGQPVLPHILAADIGGGAYPAIINVLLALIQRERSGRGCHIDIAMAENVLPFLYAGLAKQLSTGMGVTPGGEVTTGGTARYQIYKTKDGRYLSVAPVEDRFWSIFAATIGLSDGERQDGIEPSQLIALVRRKIASRDLAEWTEIFARTDVCVAPVATLEDALGSPQFLARGTFSFKVTSENAEIAALPVPIVAHFRGESLRRSSPRLSAVTDMTAVSRIWQSTSPE
jgi:alpha-methylacyl-CoA racemase